MVDVTGITAAALRAAVAAYLTEYGEEPPTGTEMSKLVPVKNGQWDPQVLIERTGPMVPMIVMARVRPTAEEDLAQHETLLAEQRAQSEDAPPT